MPKASQNPADALRAVPPREFVQARNALAAKLAKDGQATEARDIRRLPRPSPVVWALNRTAVGRPRELNALVQAVDGLRRAQLGQGELRAATERYRAAFEPLVRNATEALRDAGSAISPALERRIRSTLLAATTDRRLRADLATPGAWSASTRNRALPSCPRVPFRPGSFVSGQRRRSLLPSPAAPPREQIPPHTSRRPQAAASGGVRRPKSEGEHNRPPGRPAKLPDRRNGKCAY